MAKGKEIIGDFIETEFEVSEEEAEEIERRTQKNPEKVTLGKIENLEFYVYPYKYPESVWVSTNPSVQKLDKYAYRKLFGILNRAKSFLNGNWRKKARTTFQKKLVKAYNYGMKRVKGKKKS